MSYNNGGFITIFFYQNGSCVNPEKVRLRKCDIAKTILKEGKCCFYRGKCVFTMTGEFLGLPTKVVNNNAYVLVNPTESFKHLNYAHAFAAYKRTSGPHVSLMEPSGATKSSNPNTRKCQSTPVIPSSCCKEENQTSYIPCVESDSQDEECPCDIIYEQECGVPRKARKISPPPPPKGFLAKVCPCCVKAKPSLCPSKPMFACGNGKMTQTTKEDFKCAVNRMKREIAQEKKRKKMYNQNTSKGCRYKLDPQVCPQNGGFDACENPKNIKKIEAKRAQFLEKREAAEKKLAKALDKRYAKILEMENCPE